ncbi:MAG: hypothetical protein FWE85_05620, partial [Clostridiales bacterium]|nr:hypothetical protein [Clostridiales bacterium]
TGQQHLLLTCLAQCFKNLCRTFCLAARSDMHIFLGASPYFDCAYCALATLRWGCGNYPIN